MSIQPSTSTRASASSSALQLAARAPSRPSSASLAAMSSVRASRGRSSRSSTIRRASSPCEAASVRGAYDLSLIHI
eukprot:6387570-Prymnesium_polylepis.1